MVMVVGLGVCVCAFLHACFIAPIQILACCVLKMRILFVYE